MAFATVLSCIDSRTSAELIFDQGLGDIFSIRIAGNFANQDILGSMEFVCNVAGSKLVVVFRTYQMWRSKRWIRCSSN